MLCNNDFKRLLRYGRSRTKPQGSLFGSFTSLSHRVSVLLAHIEKSQQPTVLFFYCMTSQRSYCTVHNTVALRFGMPALCIKTDWNSPFVSSQSRYKRTSAFWDQNEFGYKNKIVEECNWTVCRAATWLWCSTRRRISNWTIWFCWVFQRSADEHNIATKCRDYSLYIYTDT